MSDPTRGVPVAGGPPPPGPPPSGPLPPGPGDDQPDRRLLYAIAGLLSLIVLLVVVLLLVRAGDDSDTVATESTTTTSTSSSTSTSTSSTTSPDSTSSTSSTSIAPTTTEPSASMPTTTTTPPTTTTAAPPTTIDPDRCTGATRPDDPDPVAITFYDAWTVDDRTCAEAIGTEEAIDTLFVLDGAGADWEFVACDPDEETSEQHIDCAFRYEGGAAIFELRLGAIDGWQVFDVDFQAD